MTTLRHSRCYVDQFLSGVLEYNPLSPTIQIHVNRLYGNPRWFNFNKRREWLTESKALLKSVYIKSVCIFFLNPFITIDDNSRTLVVVKLRLTKPCWHGDMSEEHKCCKWEVIIRLIWYKLETLLMWCR